MDSKSQRKNSVIYITLPLTEGRTGKDWEDWFARKGYEISDEEKEVLFSPKFKPTNGLKRTVAIIIDDSVDKVATKNKFVILRPREAVDPEIACQIRSVFSRHGITELNIAYFATISGEPMAYFNNEGQDSPDGWFEH